MMLLVKNRKREGGGTKKELKSNSSVKHNHYDINRIEYTEGERESERNETCT